MNCPECKVRGQVVLVDHKEELYRCMACGVVDYKSEFENKTKKQKDKDIVKPCLM